MPLRNRSHRSASCSPLPSAELLRWSPAGYELRSAGPKGGRVQVITPQSLIALLRHGWTPLVPLIHPAAQ